MEVALVRARQLVEAQGTAAGAWPVVPATPTQGMEGGSVSAPRLPINPNVGDARQDRIVPGTSGKWCQPICVAGFTAAGRVKKGVKETRGKIIWSGRCLQHICDPCVSLHLSGVWLHYCLTLPLPPPPVFICSL